jgi:hypothetical protein
MALLQCSRRPGQAPAGWAAVPALRERNGHACPHTPQALAASPLPALAHSVRVPLPLGLSGGLKEAARAFGQVPGQGLQACQALCLTGLVKRGSANISQHDLTFFYPLCPLPPPVLAGSLGPSWTQACSIEPSDCPTGPRQEHLVAALPAGKVAPVPGHSAFPLCRGDLHGRRLPTPIRGSATVGKPLSSSRRALAPPPAACRRSPVLARPLSQPLWGVLALFKNQKGPVPYLQCRRRGGRRPSGQANDRGRSTRSSLAHFGHPLKDFQR